MCWCVSVLCLLGNHPRLLTSVYFAAAARANPECGDCIALHEGGGDGTCACAKKGVGCDTRAGADYDTVYRIPGGEYLDVLQAVCQLLSFRPSRSRPGPFSICH